MPRLRRLSGREVLKALRTFGFEVDSMRGSHVKLSRTLDDGTRQILTVPHHTELAAGTVRAIFRQAARFIDEAELRKHFFR